MKTSELTGAELDAAVAMIEGIDDLVEKDGRMCHVREWDPEGLSWRDSLRDWVMWVDYAPSQRWDHGGPIIERERICVSFGANQDSFPGWGALMGPERYNQEADAYGPTPLIAAMRAFVASKYGEELPDQHVADGSHQTERLP